MFDPPRIPIFARTPRGDTALTATGLAEIDRTATLRDLLERNTPNLGDRFVGMTRRDWRRE